MLIHRSPQIVLLPVDFQEYFIKMPCVSWFRATFFQLIGIPLAEFQTPLTNRFIGEHDAALGHDLLNIAITEGETEIEPDTVADNFCGETVSFVEIC